MEKDLEECFQEWARVTKPNSNLADAFVKKAKNDTIVLRSIPETDKEWRAATAYYARYHMITALLLKVGIECKDHNCSIKIAEKLFSDTIPRDLFDEIKEAKKQRISLQYYTDRPVEEKKFRQNINNVDAFVEKTLQVLEFLTREGIEAIRRKLE